MAVPTESRGSERLVPGVSGLLRKDIAVFVPRDRLIVAMVYLLAHHTALFSEEAFLWLGIVLAGALALYVPIVEWHQETDRMLSSLPVRRATVVFARYISSGSALVFAAVAWISTGTLLSPLLAAGRGAPGMWTTFEGVVTFILIGGLLVSLYLPLYFRLGLTRGATAFFGLTFALYVLASIPLGVFAPGEVVQNWVVAMKVSMGPGWVLFLILAAMGAAMAFSGRMSIRWFERRDL